MFTGIIEQVGKVAALETDADGAKLRVGLGKAPAMAEGRQLGESISVNGCCLTVVEFGKHHFSVDLSGETLRRTSFGEARTGDAVNLERPLSAGGRVGGHFVQGHIDGVGRVESLTPEGGNWWLAVRVPENLRRYVVEKGSIAVDGISLTVAQWRDGIANIAVIPFTYQHTNVQAMKAGKSVNLEVDILAKYVESLLGAKNQEPTSKISMEELKQQGF